MIEDETPDLPRRDLRQRWATFRFWLAVLRDYGFNPFAAMVDFKREADYNAVWLMQTERALGGSVPPPEGFSR